MKIGIISRKKIEDQNFWSGTINKVYKTLLNNGIDIVKIENLTDYPRKYYLIKREYNKIIKKKKFDENYNINLAKFFAIQIEKKIKKIHKLDYLLCFDFSLISYLKTDIPIIIWTDILYTDYYNHYFNNEVIHKDTVKDIKYLEEKAIKKSEIILFSSSWSKNIAIKKYKKQKNKFFVLNFGSNLIYKFRSSILKKKLKIYKHDVLKVVIFAVDWKRKGVDKAIKLKEKIESKGLKTVLTIVGAKNIIKKDRKGLNYFDFIDKKTGNGANLIAKIYLKNHFNLLFSKSEAYGISLIEANSMGTPNIVYKTGGINEIVINNRNGLTYRSNTSLDKISNDVIKLFKNKKLYQKLVVSSYNEFLKKFEDKIIFNKFCNIIKN